MDEDGSGLRPGEGSVPQVGGDAGQLIHDEFAEAASEQRPESHRWGMLGGLAVVGVLLAVLVALSPGGSTPRLPAQTVHDVGPVLTVGPKTAAATAPPVPSTPSTTTSTLPGGAVTPTTWASHRSVSTTPAPVSLVETPGTTTVAGSSTTTPAAPTTTTTSAAPPPPPPTTTTCILILCN
jgi:hypothetical protein